jgi:hypothetical protein
MSTIGAAAAGRHQQLMRSRSPSAVLGFIFLSSLFLDITQSPTLLRVEADRGLPADGRFP